MRDQDHPRIIIYPGPHVQATRSRCPAIHKPQAPPRARKFEVPNQGHPANEKAKAKSVALQYHICEVPFTNS